jgi:dipeptidyl aminopeptidase/acylaminoacyl peptidase
MHASHLVTLFCCVLLFAAGCGGSKEAPPVYERSAFFGNPERASVTISADGSRLAWLAPLDGVLNVWVAPASDPKAAVAVTADKGRGIRQYFWLFERDLLMYMQDDGGDENWAAHVVNVSTKEDRNLTAIDQILDAAGKPIMLPSGKKMRPTARIVGVSPKFPSEIILGLNDRNPQYHDLYRCNVLTGERTLLVKNDQFAGFVVDDSYRVRFADKSTADGGDEYFTPDGAGGWKSFLVVGPDDALTTGPIGFDKTENLLYLRDSRGRNTSALMSWDLTTGAQKLLAEDPKADIDDMMQHPTERTVQAVASTYAKKVWKVLDPALEEHFDNLAKVCDGEMNVSDRSLNDSLWVVTYVKDDGPVQYYLYDRTTGKATFLFTNRPALEKLELAKMYPVVITARDGKELVSYLTLPPWIDDNGSAREPVPLILFVHGGPWARDNWGLNGYHQWLANRGYAVLSVNYRGSTGFGKNFTNAGNREWGGKMHDDLIDAVEWAVKENIAPREKIAIMGGSYGGYATLAGLTFTPDVFACGVDIVGPSNIRTLLETIPPYWKPMMEMWARRVGDPRTEEGRAFLDARSPLTHVDKIAKPLLIGQGANDPRVKQSESDQIVAAMRTKKIPVTYVLFSDEGHGFARPANRLAFNAVTELFLAKVLGGRTQAVGKDFEGSTVAVPAGAEFVPGLEAALPKR